MIALIESLLLTCESEDRSKDKDLVNVTRMPENSSMHPSGPTCPGSARGYRAQSLMQTEIAEAPPSPPKYAFVAQQQQTFPPQSPSMPRCETREPPRSPEVVPRCTRGSAGAGQSVHKGSASTSRSTSVPESPRVASEPDDDGYVGVPGDTLDQNVAWHVQQLHTGGRCAIDIHRLGHGDYMFNGARVNLVWKECAGGMGVFVESTQHALAEPLSVFLLRLASTSAVPHRQPRGRAKENVGADMHVHQWQASDVLRQHRKDAPDLCQQPPEPPRNLTDVQHGSQQKCSPRVPNLECAQASPTYAAPHQVSPPPPPPTYSPPAQKVAPPPPPPSRLPPPTTSVPAASTAAPPPPPPRRRAGVGEARGDSSARCGRGHNVAVEGRVDTGAGSGGGCLADEGQCQASPRVQHVSQSRELPLPSDLLAGPVVSASPVPSGSSQLRYHSPGRRDNLELRNGTEYERIAALQGTASAKVPLRETVPKHVVPGIAPPSNGGPSIVPQALPVQTTYDTSGGRNLSRDQFMVAMSAMQGAGTSAAFPAQLSVSAAPWGKASAPCQGSLR